MTKRNYGIDFLRILSMFMVVLRHVLGNDGAIYGETANASYWTAWFIEISAIVAVNCFALISGYVMCNSTPKMSKLFSLWLQTVFYTVGLFVLFAVITKDFSISGFLKACLPVSTKRYWYISAYFGMFVLIPFLNTIIEYTEKKLTEKTMVACFVVFCVFSIVIPMAYEPFNIEGGYSTLWLCMMYIVGGYIKKYGIAQKTKKSAAALLYLSMTVLTFILRFVLHYGTQTVIGKPMFTDILMGYISPTIVVASVALFVFCSKLSFSGASQKIISFFAPASLGVYLIHFNTQVWKYVFNERIKLNLIEQNPLVVVLLVFATAIAVYVVCSIIEIGRIYLFKVLKINKLAQAFESLICSLYNKICSRFTKEEKQAVTEITQ